MQTNIAATIGGLKDRHPVSVRWVAAQNVHLTLKFLGIARQTELEQVREMLLAEADRTRTFKIEVGRIGAFPNLRRPRVIWIGVQAPPPLFDLQKRIEHACRRLHLLSEERPFSPHLTVGRVASNINPTESERLTQTLMEFRSSSNLGVVQVERIALIQSELLPRGAVYTPLFHAPLQSTD